MKNLIFPDLHLEFNKGLWVDIFPYKPNKHFDGLFTTIEPNEFATIYFWWFIGQKPHNNTTESNQRRSLTF